ncbi:MAG: FtsW/RodA/SpoVE family cell cycle protein, partial [Ruminococcus sp.]|nr:FtsW/RodA/SpoVE family cell cycle protein [Ruminococcus sp.]
NTGISLPFFSYGGTALIIQLAEMGILLSISRQGHIKK